MTNKSLNDLKKKVRGLVNYSLAHLAILGGSIPEKEDLKSRVYVPNENTDRIYNQDGKIISSGKDDHDLGKLMEEASNLGFGMLNDLTHEDTSGLRIIKTHYGIYSERKIKPLGLGVSAGNFPAYFSLDNSPVGKLGVKYILGKDKKESKE